jgi:hypothetical protein
MRTAAFAAVFVTAAIYAFSCNAGNGNFMTHGPSNTAPSSPPPSPLAPDPAAPAPACIPCYVALGAGLAALAAWAASNWIESHGNGILGDPLGSSSGNGGNSGKGKR